MTDNAPPACVLANRKGVAALLEAWCSIGHIFCWLTRATLRSHMSALFGVDYRASHVRARYHRTEQLLCHRALGWKNGRQKFSPTRPAAPQPVRPLPYDPQQQ